MGVKEPKRRKPPWPAVPWRWTKSNVRSWSSTATTTPFERQNPLGTQATNSVLGWLSRNRANTNDVGRLEVVMGSRTGATLGARGKRFVLSLRRWLGQFAESAFQLLVFSFDRNSPSTLTTAWLASFSSRQSNGQTKSLLGYPRFVCTDLLQS